MVSNKKKVTPKILGFCYGIKQYSNKRRENHKKIGFGLIGESAIKSFNNVELGKLIDAFCQICHVEKPKNWIYDHEEYVKDQLIW